MNRRDFAKGLAALPFAGAATAFASICNSTCKSDPNSLRVVLQGPFAVVINSANGNIRAFTPKDPKHMFAFNDSPADNGLQYRFQLQLTGWPSPPPALCVQNRFPKFCAEHTQFDFSNTQDHFVTIDLPGPNRIIVVGSRFKADMQDGTTSVPVPGDHILEYDIAPGAITMTGSYDGTATTLDPSLDLVFTFEVGLARSLGGAESDLDGSHARDFYNGSLLPHFPGLAGDPARKIKQVNTLVNATAHHNNTLAQSHKVFPKQSSEPTPHRSIQRQPERQHPFTTTYECKSGGLLATSP